MLDSYPGVSHARTSGETVIPAASLRFSPAASAVLAVTGTPLPSASSFRRPSSRAKDSTTRAYFRSHPEDHVAPSRTDPPPSRRNHRPPRPTTAGTSCSQHFLLCFRARFVLFPPLSWSLSGFHRGSPLPKHIDPDRWWRRPRVLELRREGGLPLLWVLQERAARGSRRRLLRNLWPGPSIQYKTQQLRREVQRLQKKLHPDLVHSKSEKERAFAAEQSALVIDAYRTLNKPLPRALYMLQLEGIHVDEEKTINDPELLMEMMEIREAVSEASDSQTLGKIQSQMKRKLETWEKSFEEAFKKRDFDHAVEATQRMRYYERAMEETVKKL